jgi:hypothetical protein
MRELISMRSKRAISSAVAASTLFAGMVAMAAPASAGSAVYAIYESYQSCENGRWYIAQYYATDRCIGQFRKNANGTISGGYSFKFYW